MRTISQHSRFRNAGQLLSPGFTLIELMIVLMIIAIGVALAVPSYRSITEKRQLTAATEDIAAFMNFAQSEAIKRNELVTVNMRRNSHNLWCVGAILRATACDCRIENTAHADFCDIEDVPFRMEQEHVVGNPDYELMHSMELDGTATSNASFSFDPVRGTLLNLNTVKIQMHTNRGSGATRDYQLDINMLPTGRVSICTATGRKHLLKQYPTCS